MMTCRRLCAVGVVLAAWCFWPGQARGEQECRVLQHGKQVELCSPFFVFRLDTATGLRAVSWENRLTAKSIPLGNGPELEFDLGLPEQPLEVPRLQVSKAEVKDQGETAEVVFQLAAKEPAASASVTYRWDAVQPVLRKFVTITNQGPKEWNRLLNIRLGTYPTDAKLVDKEQGFPVYLNDQYFMSLAHPAGWATGKGNQVSLRQYPGMKLAPGKTFDCMEAVYGVAPAGQARKDFIAHVRSRMRRVLRGHDKPYAIFEPFGARPGGNFDETEEFVLDSIAKVAQGQRESGCHFDFYSIDFWVDFHGDVKKCDRQRFPNGLTKILPALKAMGTLPGLWISPGSAGWSIGGNPAVKASFTDDSGMRFCLATEPIKSLYIDGFRHHIRENGVRLLKFDAFLETCANPNHNHLSGVYASEAIVNGMSEILRALDRECPDVFLMDYSYNKPADRSPWSLLDFDTLIDSGLHIEAASPSDQPAPYARDSITQKLDQAQWVSNENVPPLGKDSLGVWLSDWGPWNSQVGKERWEGGIVMDICRGSLLAQPWSDTPWLSPLERKQMAEFIALLKAQPGCFGNSRFILGDPFKDEPYGYCCTDGKRAFLALHNCCWKDSVLRLELNSAWGLPDGQDWDLYRWYPDPARLSSPQATSFHTAAIALRPFEIVLLEVVPHGQPPALDRQFDSKPVPKSFAEPSRSLEIAIQEVRKEEKVEDKAIWTVLEPARFTSSGGATLRKLPDGSILAGGENPSPDTYTITAQTDLNKITGFRLEALADPSLPATGPGRAYNGNFALNEFRVTASPRSAQGEAVPVKLRNPVADFSQETFGRWPVAAALDGDSKTGWSIDPLEGKRHVAILETEKPHGFPGGTTLEFVLQQGSPVAHNLGRLRLSATTAKPPLPSPKPTGPRSLIVKGQVPACPSGGLLVVTVKMTRGSQPMRVGGPGKYLTAQVTLAGQPAACKPVLGTATFPSCWQAWRVAVGPSTEAQAFELAIAADFGPDVQLSPEGHFVPR